MRRLATLLLFVAACSSESEPYALDQLSATYATVACEYEARCCAAGETEFASADECRASLTYLNYFEWEQELVGEGELEYLPERAKQCIEQMASGCDPDFNEGVEFSACGQLFIGTGGFGDACSDRLDCGDGLVCNTGVCGPVPGLGEACGGGSGCTGDLFCRDFVCVQLPAVGEACADFVDCASRNCVDGVCQEPICNGL